MRNSKKLLSILLCLCMLVQNVPVAVLAAGDALCTHHEEHTVQCGYVPGADCNHVCGEACQVLTTACVHVHGTDGCSYVEATETEDASGECNHSECTVESGCVKTETVCIHTDHVDCSYAEGAPCTFDPAACTLCAPQKETTPQEEIPQWCDHPDCDQTDNAHVPACGWYVRTYEECLCVLSCQEEGLNEFCETCYFEGVEACGGGEEEQIPYDNKCGENATWTLIDGVLTISGTGAMTDYLANDVRWDKKCESIKSVVIKSGITSIGRFAFMNCVNLTNVTIPSSVKTIGNYAFDHCTKLENITIPEGVESIGQSAFCWCASLTSITIPSTVKEYGYYPFSCCEGLTSVNVAEGSTILGFKMFENCFKLTNVTLPSTLTTIEGLAFYNTSITSITIPASVKTIGNDIFYGCDNLDEVTFEGNPESMDNRQFGSCTKSLTINVPCNWSHAETYAVSDGTVTVNKPDHEWENGKCKYCGVIGGYCGRPTLEDQVWTYADGVLTISGSGLMKLYEKESIPWAAYRGQITKVVVKEGIKNIGQHAFDSCTKLTEVSLPSTLTSMGANVFYCCVSLTEITIPDKVTAISAHAFNGCKSLATVNIGESVETIYHQAFDNCDALLSVTIPEGVKQINQKAFYGFYLETITFTSADISIETPQFSDPGRLATVNVPCNWKETTYTFADDVTVRYAAHAFLDGICSVCGAEEPNTVYTITITASANPTEGGTITGAGAYEAGETVTLRAVPNSGYQFVNWTRNGEVVSSNATYTFTVMQDDTLVANFEQVAPCETHAWTFEAQGDTITATCTVCQATGSLTLKPPANLISNSTTPREATVEGSIPGVVTPEITYTGVGISDGRKPTLYGTYTASITIAEGVTASITFQLEATAVATITLEDGTVWTRNTLGEAISVANDKPNSTLTLLMDQTPKSMYWLDGTFTLDLNGYSIINSTNTAFLVEHGAAIIIKDSQSGGKIYGCNSNQGAYGGCIINEGSLTIQSGIIDYDHTRSWSGAIVNRNELIVTGGQLGTSADTWVILNTNSAVMTIKGGTIKGKIEFEGNATIAGGTFEAKEHYFYSGTATISGGTFANGLNITYKGYGTPTAEIEITGGTFEKQVEHTVGTLTLKGGTFQQGIKTSADTLKDLLAAGYGYTDIETGEEIADYSAQAENTTPCKVASISFSITIEPSANGTVTAESTAAAAGSNVTLTISPATGYKLKSLIVDDNNVTAQVANNLYTFTMPAKNVTVRATFQVIQYPVKVQDVVVTALNKSDVLEDGTVSYDPATLTLTLNNADISYGSGAAIHSTYPDYTLTIVGTETNSILSTGGSGIYASKQNISISGGTFLISGSTNGIFAENGTLTVDSAQVKAVGTGNGVYAKNGITVTNGGGLLAVTGNAAVVRGIYTMGEESFAKLSVTEDAKLIIESGKTVTVSESITSSGKIEIQGTLKVPEGSGKSTMSGGTLYIGTKGYQWDAEKKTYICLVHDWNYTASGATITADCDSCDTVGGTVTLSATGGVYSGSAYKASLNISEDWQGAAVSDDSIVYQYRKTQNESYVNAADQKNTGFYEASITVNDVAASVTYEVMPKALQIRDITATDRDYVPGNTEVSISAVTFDGTANDDVLTVTATGTLADATAGTDKPVSVTIALSGDSVDNYSYPTTATTTVTIRPRSLNADGVTAVLSDNLIFAGAAIPTLTVKDGNITLTMDTDYIVTQTETNGLVTLTVTGKGNYKDTFSSNLTYLVVTLPNPDKVEPDDKDAIDAYEYYSKQNETYKDAELTEALKALKEALTDYNIIKGHKSSYTKGSGKIFTFTANGYFGKFTGLKVDGKLLDTKYYSAKSGSTIVTLKNSYLDGLSDGKHTIEFLYTDGSTGDGHYFRIASNNGSPFTGDNNHTMLLTGVMMTSLLCIAVMAVFARQKKGKFER